MAAKDNKPLVIWHSIFVLLSVGLAIGWYYTFRHGNDLERRLDLATKAEAASKNTITGLQGDATRLKELIGRTEATDQVVSAMKSRVRELSGDGSSSELTLDAGVVKNAVDRNMNLGTSAQRLIALNAKTRELEARIAANANSLKSLEDALAEKLAALSAKETMHRDQLAQRTRQKDEIDAQLLAVQTAFSNARDAHDNLKRDLESERDRNSASLKELRKARMLVEDLKFERPNGSILFVDQDAALCTIDLGSRDDLNIGTTFSVYSKSNSGVGRRQSDKDIKGKLEIVEIQGAHHAKARIVSQKLNDPVAMGDPIYSPLFWPGQSLKIAVVGTLDFDGNPGSDREEFHTIVKTAGAEVIMEVDDMGELRGPDQEQLTVADIPNRITSAVRFLVVADLGDENTADTEQRAINNRIRARKVEMEDAAHSTGVYVLPLSSFLEYVGYSSKRRIYTPTKEYPAILANGAKSERVDDALGSRSSSAAISGAFSKRRQKPLVSTGATSRLYHSNARAE